MAGVEELKLDLEELKHLRHISTRPRVIAFLSSEIAVLDDQVKSKSSQSSTRPSYVFIQDASVFLFRNF